MPIRPIEWISERTGGLLPGHVRMIDQTRLPTDLVYIETQNVDDIHEAIKMLRVRGAPAIGVAAAMGVLCAIQNKQAATGAGITAEVAKAAGYLAGTRPTAVNLFKALDRMKAAAEAGKLLPPDQLLESLARETIAIFEEDRSMCRRIGEHGASLLKNGQRILTHCNAGSLATSEYGTALAPLYLAKEQGKIISVYSDETRPLLQGSRLTAWELDRAGIDVTVICDNTAAQVMKEGKIDAVLVGADRIAANGDTANKIGTYGVAVLANAHGIPFYVLAPSSTFDMSLATGSGIPIEERGPEEVVCGFGKRTAPAGVRVYSPAFDVTPARLITAIISEKGIARPDFTKSLVEFA
ncbi:MAG: S-methyl-5-thioribose-1-phosphate isomerase [bacterium]